MYSSEVFSYIISHPGENGRAVSDKYKTVESLQGKIIVAREFTRIEVCDLNAFLKRDADIPVYEKRYHEVVLERMRQKIRFDFDATKDDLYSISPAQLRDLCITFCNMPTSIEMPNTDAEKFRMIYEYIKSRVRETYILKWHHEPDFVECESLDPSGAKFSRHLIIDGACVSSNHQSAEFTRVVAESLPSKMRTMLDFGVNKTLQNFRIAGHHKTVTDLRTKQILTPGKTLVNSLLTATENCKLLEDYQIASKSPAINDVDDYVASCAMALWKRSSLFDPNFTYRSSMKNFVNFDRTGPSQCAICEKIHDKDNTLSLHVKRDGSHYFVNVCCRKRTSQRRYVGTFIINPTTNEMEVGSDLLSLTPNTPGDFKETLMAHEIKQALASLEQGELHNNSLFDQMDNSEKHVYDEPKMRDLEVCKTLCVQAPMKVGKTRALADLIKNHYPSSEGLVEKVIRFVSFRQTFSNNLKSIFPEATLYSDVQGALTQARVIVQVESLFRLERSIVPDLLVLDEVEAILEQFNAGLMKQADQSFQNFAWMIRYAGQVVCMDANLSDRTYKMLMDLRPSFAEEDGRIFHKNIVKNAHEMNMLLYDCKGAWLDNLISSLDTGDKVVIPTNVLNFAKAIGNMIRDKFPEKEVKIYSSETDQAEKQAHFRDVNTYWRDYDVVIYTPTITAGISFEAAHFQKVFAHFVNLSCSAASCIQMLGRVRNVLMNETHILFEHIPANVPVKIEDISKWLFERFSLLGFDEPPKMEQIFTSIEYGRDGKSFTARKDNFLNIWLENKRVENTSRMHFMREFIRYASVPGTQIKYVDDEVWRQLTGDPLYEEGELREELKNLRGEFNTAMQTAIGATSEAIAGSRELADAECSELCNAIHEGVFVARNDLLALEKYWLRKVYDYQGEIDAKFVSVYDKEKPKDMFRNLTHLFAHPDPQTAIAHVRDNDKIHINDCNSGFAPVRGHTYRYIAPKMSIGFGIVEQCGWTHINDKRVVNTNQLYDSLSDPTGFIWRKMSVIAPEFELSSISHATMQRYEEPLDYVLTMLKTINKILRLTYGTYIKPTGDADTFHLAPIKLFTFDPLDKSKPLIVQGDGSGMK